MARESNNFQYPKPTTDERITAEREQTAAWCRTSRKSCKCPRSKPPA